MKKENLRTIAEKKLKKREISTEDNIKNLTQDELGSMIHELRVHQIELEMQNEELERIQNDLDLAKARYFDIYDLAPEGYMIMTDKGIITESNFTAANMLGIDRNNLKNQNFTNFIFKDDQDIYYHKQRLLLKTKEPQECEFRLRKFDGTYFWGRIKATVVMRDDMSFCRIIMIDVTDRVIATIKLKESEEKYRLVYSAMSQGLAILEFITDKSGNPIDFIFVDLNETYAKFFGVNRKKAIGKSINQIIPNLNPICMENYKKVALNRQSIECENYFKPMGKYYTIYIYSIKEKQIAVLVTDISEQKQIHQQLKLKEKSLLASQKIARLGTWNLDYENKTGVWSEELYNIYGLDPSLPPPEYIELSELFTPESAKRLDDAFKKAIADGTPYELELEMITKSGSRGWIWVIGEPERDESGQITGLWGAAQDITERVKTLNALKYSENILDKFFQQSLTGFFIMMLDEPIYWNDSVDKEAILEYLFDHQRFTRINQAMLKQYKGNYEDFINKTPRDFYANNIENGKKLWQAMLDNKILHTVFDLKDANGTTVYVEGDYICIYDDLGRFIGNFGIQQDITARIQKQIEIEHISSHDYLTDLYNRRHYFEEFKVLDNPEYYPIGVMMLDVNGLKIINDAFGHGTGDIVLKTLGKAIKSVFEKNEIVSRIGGDEFAVLLPNTSMTALQKYKEEIIEKVKTLKIKNVELSLAVGFEVKNKPEEKIDDILKLAENHMYRHKSIIGSSVRSHAINAILQTLTEKYKNERRHSFEVSRLCKLIGKQMKLKTEELVELEQAGLFHDIGKISIPDNIINKTSRLTEEEFDIIKTHTEIGYQILRAADEYSDLAIHALYHHERWDGKGYPSGLKGEDIPLFSRIICVVDAFEAMTADRPYRKKMSHENAISEIIRYSGTQFDPKIAQIFIREVLGDKNNMKTAIQKKQTKTKQNELK